MEDDYVQYSVHVYMYNKMVLPKDQSATYNGSNHTKKNTVQRILIDLTRAKIF